MLESVLQVLAYSGVGLVVLAAGFVVLDLLTPGKLGQLVMEGNPGAGLMTATSLVSLGLGSCVCSLVPLSLGAAVSSADPQPASRPRASRAVPRRRAMTLVSMTLRR